MQGMPSGYVGQVYYMVGSWMLSVSGETLGIMGGQDCTLCVFTAVCETCVERKGLRYLALTQDICWPKLFLKCVLSPNYNVNA